MSHEDERRAAAVQRLKERRDFTSHIVAYIVVNTVLIVIWAVSGAGYFWPIWSLAGWGAGLTIHAWTTFGRQPINEADIRREMERGV